MKTTGEDIITKMKEAKKKTAAKAAGSETEVKVTKPENTMDKATMKALIIANLKNLYRKEIQDATPQQIYQAVAYSVKDTVIDDWIATQCNFNFDIHNVEGAGLDKNGAQAKFRSKGGYTIPYRALIPKGLDGLLLAGRDISGTHKAHSNYRVMPICAGIGEAAGAAAAIAVRSGKNPRDVAASDIQKELI